MDNNDNKKSALDSLNELFKQTSRYFTLEYKLLIYRLLKRGHVKIVNLAEDTELSETRLYQIVDEVNKLTEEEGASQ